METIANEMLRVTVSPVGAEVCSVMDVQTGREYIWQADARWWNRHAPILFPIVGGLWNGTCRFGYRSVALPKHGLMRTLTWTVADRRADRVRLEYASTVATFHTFPFAFRLAVTYRLEGRTVRADFEVENPGAAPLHFQLGGHPGFNLPDWAEEHEVDGYLHLEGQPRSLLRAGEQGCLEPERLPLPALDDGLLPLRRDTFSHDALIFDSAQVTAATVLDRDRRPVVRVESGAPVWLFWSPAGMHAPFVCCEPWYGLCDYQGFAGDVSERPYIQHLPAHQTWQGYYAFTCH